MGFTVAAFLQSIAQNSHLELNALSDQHLITNGKDITVPDLYDKLMGVYASGITINRAQISSPTMRKSLILDADNLNIGVEPLSPPPFVDMFDNPRQLKASEGLRALATQGSAGAEIERIIVFLGDGKIDKPAGEVMTVKCTGTTTLTADAWSLIPLTFSQQLESGKYQIVGARFDAAGAVAGRLVIPGSAWRPGAIGSDLASDIPAERFQSPVSGIWGEFSHSFPPQAEILSVSADTAETVYLDLIKIA